MDEVVEIKDRKITFASNYFLSLFNKLTSKGISQKEGKERERGKCVCEKEIERKRERERGKEKKRWMDERGNISSNVEKILRKK